jgi:hypothetical protein
MAHLRVVCSRTAAKVSNSGNFQPGNGSESKPCPEATALLTGTIPRALDIGSLGDTYQSFTSAFEVTPEVSTTAQRQASSQVLPRASRMHRLGPFRPASALFTVFVWLVFTVRSTPALRVLSARPSAHRDSLLHMVRQTEFAHMIVGQLPVLSGTTHHARVFRTGKSEGIARPPTAAP